MTLLRTDPSARRPPPPGARETVMRDGLRRRRLAFAGAGSAAAVAIVAVAGLLAGTTAGSDSLRVDQPAGGSSPSAPAAVAMAGAQAGSTTGEGQPQRPGTVQDAQSMRGAPVTAAQPSAQPTSAPASSPRRREPMTRRTSQQVCPGSGVGVGTSGVIVSGDWCLTVNRPQTRNAAAQATLTFSICRNATMGRAGLTYSTTQEADFTISVPKTKTTAEAILWRWSTGQRFAASRHTLTVGGTDCYDWVTGWDWRDERGRLVPTGQSLRLAAESTARELAFKEVSTDFTS
ncbi:MAG: hypothetical protein QOI82_3151 [Actinomycetota bacterium]|jgi:hypothetical protein|nr:hypothetical protein [Actinomycetota bacterium]